MSAFARALRSFQSGHVTDEELFSEIYRQLSVEKASPEMLLEILKLQQATQPLPERAHESILNQIAAWPQDPTVVTSASQEARDARPTGPGVGSILQGRFSLVALIGEGGMSRVFKAVDLRRVEAGATDPHLAIKILTEPFNEYLGSLAALQREAHKLQSLAHPNVVRVIDCDRDGQTVFMTMEYLAGESLQKRLRTHAAQRAGGGLAGGEAIVLGVARALAYAHQNHIVHGDLKPGNVIITDRGEVKVIDFGMARFIARPGSAVPPSAQHFGPESPPKAVSVRYASAALLAGHEPEPTDDVYALACVAYEILTGKHPFGRRKEGFARDPQGVPPKPPRMPERQYQALLKALAFDAKERTASVEEFLRDFAPLPQRRLRDVAVVATVLVVLGLLLALALGAWHTPAAASHAAIQPPSTAIRDCPTCPLMKVVTPGRFTQGADEGDREANAAQLPRHPVTLTRPFAMSTHEVTVAEFGEFVDASARDMHGCTTYDGRWVFQPSANWRLPGFTQGAAHPVTCVSWNDATAYADWLSHRTGHHYRLPSASEWEYAARAGRDVARPWLGNPVESCRDANVADQTAARRFPGWEVFPCSDGFVHTAPVGAYQANAFGLHDLFGNVFEWVQDCWSDDYQGAPTDGSPRMDGDCKEHELRGGSWFSAPQTVTAAYRNRFAADYRSSSVGMRLVREDLP